MPPCRPLRSGSSAPHAHEVDGCLFAAFEPPHDVVDDAVVDQRLQALEVSSWAGSVGAFVAVRAGI